MKLTQQTGSSVLIALALLLICMMVASSVIVAATSGATRNATREQKQQAYLAISSASDLLMEELQDVGEFVGRAERKQYGCSQYAVSGCREHYTYLGVSGDIIGYKFTDCTEGREATILPELCISDASFSNRYLDSTSTVKGLLKEVIEEATLAVYESERTATYEKTFWVDARDERLPKVNCVFTMDTEYDITIVLSTNESEYALTISLLGRVLPSATVQNEELQCTHKVYYKVRQGDHYVTRVKDDYVFTSGRKAIEKVTISWDAPQLTKGDVTQ